MSLQQQRNHSYFHFFLIGIGIYTLLPFLLLANFAQPTADDYSFAIRDTSLNFLEVQIKYYLNWSGRYFGTAIAKINPLTIHSFTLYKIYIFIHLLCFSFTVYLIIFILLRQEASKSKILAVGSIFICLYLLLIPSVSESFYFFTTYAAYQIPNIFMLLLLACIYTFFSTDNKPRKLLLICIASILCIVIVGSNEMSLIMAFMTSLLLLIANRSDRVHRNYLLFLFLICTISCLVVVLAPGNYVRMNGHPNASKFIWSTVYAAFLTVLTFYRWLAPVLIASIIYMLFIGLPLANKTKNSRLFSIDLRLAVLYFLATILLMYFAFAWSTGERATPRVENMICFFFVFGWFYLLQVALHTHGHRLQHERLLSPVIPIVAMLLFLLNLLTVENNISTAYVDLVSGKAAAYDEALKRRYAVLVTSDCQECTVDPLPAIPKSIYFMDILEGPENNDFWVNRDFAAYWGKDAVHLSAPNPRITENLSTLRESAKTHSGKSL